MKKKELMQLIKDGRYFGPLIFLEIYEADDDIPDSLIEILSTPPEPVDIVIYHGYEMAKALDKMLKDYCSPVEDHTRMHEELFMYGQTAYRTEGPGKVTHIPQEDLKPPVKYTDWKLETDMLKDYLKNQIEFLPSVFYDRYKTMGMIFLNQFSSFEDYKKQRYGQ